MLLIYPGICLMRIESFFARYNDKRWIPRDVKATPSARVREGMLLIHKEVIPNTSDKEQVNSIPNSSGEREDSQLSNSNLKLPSSNSRNLVPQKLSNPVNKLWVS